MSTQKDVAQHLGITTRQIRNLVKSGVLPSGTKGPDIDACRHAYLDYLRGKVSGRVTVKAENELDGEQERARLTHHRANLAALEEQELDGSLVRVEDVAEAVGAEYANVRARLLAIPSKTAPVVASETDTATVHELIRQSVHEALAELTADG